MRFFTGKTGDRWLSRAVLGAGISVCTATASGAPPLLAASAGSNVVTDTLRHAATREIEDPGTGNRWLLVPNAAHPGGPGRLVLVERGAVEHGVPATVAEEHEAADARPVIEAGDVIVLEANTTEMDAELEAVALSPARAGAEFLVRLKIGGRVLQAIALGSGHAEWIAWSGMR